MEVTKEAAVKTLKELADKIDGSPDGKFEVKEVMSRVQAEVGRVSTLPDRVARHPAEYLAWGVGIGMAIGAGVVAPIAVGLAKVVARAIGA